MPLIIKTTPKPPLPLRKGRGGHFDRFVIELAPVIEKLLPETRSNIRQLAERLNELGYRSSTGSPFSFGPMRKVLIRMKQLRLGEGPRTKEQAARSRAPRS